MADGILKVGQIQTSSGTGTITLGQSGETIALGTGASQTLAANTPAFRATMASAQSISNETYTLLNYDTVDYNVGVTYNTTDKTFTVPSGQAGKYFFMAATILEFGDAAGEYGDMYIQKNGTDAIGRRHVVSGSLSGRAPSIVVSGFLDLAVGDVIRARVWHKFGSSKDTSAGTTFTFFSGYKLIGA